MSGTNNTGDDSNIGKRRVRRTYEVAVEDEQATKPSDAEVQRDKTEVKSRYQPDVVLKKSRYNTNNEPHNNNPPRYKASQSDQKFILQQEYIDNKGFMDIQRKKELLQGNKVKVKDDKRSRQQIWEEKQLRNAVVGSNIDEIKVENSDRYEYVFDTEATIAFTSDQEDELPEEGETLSTEDARLLEELERERSRLLSIQETRKLLPVYQYREPLLKAIRDNQVLIIVGETGSGKTTQLPQYLIEDGYTAGGKYQIGVTQPRRVAATSVATRVSDEMEVILGQEVGYSIRFEDKTTSGKTLLKYMTDGMLLREFLTDRNLTKYSCIMIDEAHERTLATDILLGLIKDILPKRKDLKLLISSATMNSKRFSEFFNDCPIFTVPGRRFPVDIHYTLQPEANYIQAAITTIFQIHTTQKLPGDILVFLTGQEEIESMRENLEEISQKLGSRIKQLLITPIYANLPQEQQSNIFQKTPKDCRKIVLATNIAETSLTIDGIKYVIDPGFVKENSYVPSSNITQLLTVPCSKASVDQRAGRAGRVGPGKCFRLFTKWSYNNELEMMPKPEIVRTNLSHTILLLLSLGVKDLLNFPFLDKPSIPSFTKSLENLYILGALNNKGDITKLGEMMCEFPCEPEFGKVLYSSAIDERCNGTLSECLTIVSMLHETMSLFIGKKKEALSSIMSEVESDHLFYLEIYNQWKGVGYSRTWCQDHKIQFKTLLRVKNIRNQLFNCCKKLGLIDKDKEALESRSNDKEKNSRITKCFISGFATNVAKLGPTGYRTTGKSTGGLSISIHPSSIVFQNYKEKAMKPYKAILYQQLMLTSKEYIRDCIPVPEESWLTEMMPHVFK
ncbi:DEAH-box RNA-dependent ATPase PRP2 NDAI_0K01710 [Naumovozyma dairenensis CBS 421]|uniref:RNA helicase n=1 Tax=Naumovozyma dairenensis (strain ATCC 10597 / BCRC 20456 / CBS 421 / NBRC 0211 / NRRL Y-12639) TaxID=1071378 RepID=G0WHV1_NAUDC|nr:hypothetical protein NDAI_0K01710 [Naumovozyma dairenensis CBS 421]CCD27362.1 hypothetical protein NDAI_0K01710 [Naumovozyma dairenensis CBS 421]